MSASAPLIPTGRTPSAVIVRDEPRSDAAGLWLRVTADIDSACEARARAELTSLSTDGPALLVLQFADDAYVDVRGLDVLLDAARRLRGRGGGMMVVNSPYSLRRMLQILNMHDELAMAGTRGQAESWIRRSGLRSP